MTDVVADIPRWITALAEWGACLVYLTLLARRGGVLRTVAIAAAGAVALVGVQWWAGTFPLALWIPGMLLAAATMFALLFATLRVPAVTAGYLTARAFVLAELVASVAWQLDRFYAAEPGGIPQPLALGVGLVALALAWVAERRHFSTAEPLRVSRGELVSALAIAAVTFAISNLSFVTANTPFSGRLGPELLYIRTLVDLCGFIALYVQHQVRIELHARRDAEAMARLVRSQHEQYEISRRSTDELNRTYHDLKHHVEAIRAADDPDTRRRMLDALEGSISGYGEQVRTGNRVLDAVLSAKRLYAAELGIDVSYVADGHQLDFLEPLDLTAVVGNALDNAIEAGARVRAGAPRSVRLALFAQDDFVMLRVENTYDGVVRRRDGRIVTRKSADGHGYGLRNIEAAAQRYGGTVSIAADETWFALRVLFPRAAEAD